MIRSENEQAIPIPDCHPITPLGHLGSLGENFLANNGGMYDSF